MHVMSKFCIAMIVAQIAIAAPVNARAQASEIPSASSAPTPPPPGQEDKRGRNLLGQMVAALGGEAWLNRKTMFMHGHTASFFRGQPTLSTVDFWNYKQFADTSTSPPKPEGERIEFTKKRDIVQIWTAANGYEITYKGNKPLPKDQVEEFLMRRSHSLESIIGNWLKQPGVEVLYEGTTSVERRMADKVTILGANNDAVTIELEASTHLPLRRTYQSRNAQFKDYDEDSEQYDDYHLIQGIQTPLTLSRYHNGDLANQRFIIDVTYGITITPEMLDTDRPLKKKK